VGFLVLGAIALGRRRGAFGVALLAVGTVVIPIGIEAREASTFGLVWQGRYLLPIAAGLPVLAAAVLGDAWPEGLGAAMRRRAIAMLGGFVALAGAVAFVWVARRYTVGWNGPLLYFLHGRWAPPGSAIGMLVLLVGGQLVVLAAAVQWPKSWLHVPVNAQPPGATDGGTTIDTAASGGAVRQRASAEVTWLSQNDAG